MARQRQSKLAARPVRRSARTRAADAHKQSSEVVHARNVAPMRQLAGHEMKNVAGHENGNQVPEQQLKPRAGTLNKSAFSSSSDTDGMDMLSDAEIAVDLQLENGAIALASSHANRDTASLKPSDDQLSTGLVDAERRLEEYDMDARWGPNLGISRTQRYERALHLNLNPPDDVGVLLSAHPSLNVHFPLQF